MSVAVVDRAGRLRVFLQGDRASPHNIELARRKAYTARTFGRPSGEWAERTGPTVGDLGQGVLATTAPGAGGGTEVPTWVIHVSINARHRSPRYEAEVNVP